jgi:hypothetical protein
MIFGSASSTVKNKFFGASRDKAGTVRISNPISAIHLNALWSREFLCSFFRVTFGGQTRKTSKSDKVKKYVCDALCIFYIRIVTFLQQNHNVQQGFINVKSCSAIEVLRRYRGRVKPKLNRWISLAKLRDPMGQPRDLSACRLLVNDAGARCPHQSGLGRRKRSLCGSLVAT